MSHVAISWCGTNALARIFPFRCQNPFCYPFSLALDECSLHYTVEREDFEGKHLTDIQNKLLLNFALSAHLIIYLFFPLTFITVSTFVSDFVFCWFTMEIKNLKLSLLLSTEPLCKGDAPHILNVKFSLLLSTAPLSGGKTPPILNIWDWWRPVVNLTV